MSSLVIVALPTEDDYVNKISSEKVPHMTLLFLGDDVNKVKNVDKILDFVNHAASQSLMRFGLEVDHRGVLGPEQADVLFFSKTKWSGFETIRDYRSYLLKNDNIRIAYESATQFPEWQPHITLGYPATPAKPDERDFPGITYVSFDRIAVWFADNEGIEFPLKSYDWEMEAVMGDVVDNVLTHYGKKGMRWGIRTNRSNLPKLQAVSVIDKNKRIKTTGGKGFPAHADAIRARKLGQVAKKSGMKALSNKDLEDFNRRLNLEQNASRLTFQDKSKGKQFVLKLMGKGIGKGVERGTVVGGKAALSSPMVRKKIAIGAAALAM